MKNIPTRKRICIAHESEALREELKDALEREGYGVTIATTEAEAEAAISSGSAHFYVFALSPNDDQEDRVSGLLMEALSALKGFEKAFLIYSAEKRAVELLRPHWREQVFHFSELDKGQLLARIRSLFEERTPLNWSVDLFYKPLRERVQLEGGSFLEGDLLSAAVVESLRMLLSYSRSSNMTHASISSFKHQGHGGSLIFLVTPGLPMGRPMRWLMKVGPVPAIEAESKSFREVIQLLKCPKPQQLEARVAYLPRFNIAATMYSFDESAVQLQENFDTAKDDAALERVLDSIDDVFDQITMVWHANRRSDEVLFYQLVLGDAPFNESDFSLMCSGIDVQRLAGDRLIEFKYAGSALRVADPELRPRDEFLTVPHAIAHGDLHSGNILVKPGERSVMLIDYESVDRKSDAFRDFAKFETHASLDLHRVDDTHDTSTVEAFVNWQLGGNALQLEPDKSLRSWQGQCAQRIIARVRAKMLAQIWSVSDAHTASAYRLALWREYVWAWRWMKHSRQVLWRLQNLLSLSLLVKHLDPPDADLVNGGQPL